MRLILASGSPRRKELLGLFGVPFTVHPADIDETMDPAWSAFDEVARLSREKALAVPREKDDLVIAADTIVVCEGKVLGKPHTTEEAREMLTLLSGRDHQVMTAAPCFGGALPRLSPKSPICTSVPSPEKKSTATSPPASLWTKPVPTAFRAEPLCSVSGW